MPTFGSLAKIGLGAGALAAAPMTGGATLAPGLSLLASGGGGVASDYQAGNQSQWRTDRQGSIVPTGDSRARNLMQRSAWASQDAKSQADKGNAALAPLMRTLQALASGDTSQLLAATGGERRRVIDQYDTARRAIAEFTPRGGGGAAASAASRFPEASAIDTLVANKQATAQDLLAQLASHQVDAGNQRSAQADSQLAALLSLLTQKDLVISQNRMQMYSALGEGLGALLGGYLLKKTPGDGGGGGGGGDSSGAIWGNLFSDVGVNAFGGG